MLEMCSYTYSTSKTVARKSLEPGQLRAFEFLYTTPCVGCCKRAVRPQKMPQKLKPHRQRKRTAQDNRKALEP